ncbi:quinol oxidase [Streptococcus sp. zg-86]|uniref:Quinol oxidase n=1 Tax=Streptococcus zhangguiae TaxID=2664091 RepID=A0A6I4RG50_9STRE|nr:MULTISPECIES: quinol oxidase [unclassified Streptococcus]MTB63481.1 quinol oxidase [Streptococcus sp. zg-86]MTB89870.1 quinol oxidase [Streptococcus sp. zg-36]MWV55541.1 quinol oxidase [Streptococcus sp. zg-70]QTH47731.1 quinol oxidase [Streptococcus sp. zg-86]
MTETAVAYSRSENYSRNVRGGRRRRPARVDYNEEFGNNLLPTKVWPAFLWSMFVSFLSVANPFLIQLATGAQSRDLYAGMAMQAGQSPYGQFFGTGGVLYYILTYVGSFFDTSIGLAILQFIVLLIAGIYFYKIAAYFSRSAQIATNLQHWFYVFILALNFGGIQASLFVLPVLMTSLWLLIRYFENAVRDELFILYGIDAAIAVMIYPKSILFWLVATLVLLVYNATHRQMARGVYQALATIFGFLLISYSVGYYTFVEQILGAAIQQTLRYELGVNVSYDGMWWTVAQVGLFCLLSGFLKHLLQSVMSFGEGQHTYSKVIAILTFLGQSAFLITSSHFVMSQLVLLLPYGFVLALLHHAPNEQIDLELEVTTDYSYPKTAFYLPIVLCLLVFLQPAMTYFVEGDLTKERGTIAQYIQEHSRDSELVYAWDDSAQIYLRSKRLSAATIITPTPYLDTQSNQESLSFDLKKNKARYIAVNRNVSMPDSIQSNVDDQYEKVDLGTEQLTLYEKK